MPSANGNDSLIYSWKGQARVCRRYTADSHLFLNQNKKRSECAIWWWHDWGHECWCLHILEKQANFVLHYFYVTCRTRLFPSYIAYNACLANLQRKEKKGPNIWILREKFSKLRKVNYSYEDIRLSSMRRSDSPCTVHTLYSSSNGQAWPILVDALIWYDLYLHSTYCCIMHKTPLFVYMIRFSFKRIISVCVCVLI